MSGPTLASPSHMLMTNGARARANSMRSSSSAVRRSPAVSRALRDSARPLLNNRQVDSEARRVRDIQ